MAWPLLAAGGIAAGGSILGGLLGGKGQGPDTHAQLKYAKKEARKTRKALRPWRFAGEDALKQIQNLLANPSEITKFPGYEFGLGEGTKVLLRARAATGGLQSGATQKALTRFGQDYAGAQFRNYLQPYERVAAQGLAAAGQQPYNQPIVPQDYAGAINTAGWIGNLTNSLQSGLKDYYYFNALGGGQQQPTNSWANWLYNSNPYKGASYK